MTEINRRPIFMAVKAIRGDKPFTAAEVKILDAAIDEAFAEPLTKASAPGQAEPIRVVLPGVIFPTGRTISPKGVALIHSFEQCKLAAYPDPGSADGNPWTIGWGSTGPGIQRGTVWTQEQCDARFAADIADFSAKVWNLVKDVPTTQNQLDAMISLAYNIGVGAFQKSTVLRKHRAGEYHDAAAAFSMWVKNNHKVMRGLVRRRAAEADLYDDPI